MRVRERRRIGPESDTTAGGGCPSLVLPRVWRVTRHVCGALPVASVLLGVAFQSGTSQCLAAMDSKGSKVQDSSVATSLAFSPSGPLRLTLRPVGGDGSAVGEVALRNSGKQDAVVHVEVSSLIALPTRWPSVAAQAGRSTTSLVEVAPDSIVVPANDTAVMRLRTPRSLGRLPVGEYVGYLIAHAAPTGMQDRAHPCVPASVQRQVLVSVWSEGAFSNTTVAESTWTVRATRYVPFFSWFSFHGTSAVPIAREAPWMMAVSQSGREALESSKAPPSESTTPPTAGAPQRNNRPKNVVQPPDALSTADQHHFGSTAILRSSSGDVAFARWDDSVTTLSDGVIAVPLSIRQLRWAGEYSGILQILPGVDGRVRITLRVADFVMWPILALSLGLLLASRMQLYTSRERAYWLLNARLRRAVARWEAAQSHARMVAAELSTALGQGTRPLFDVSDDLQQTLNALALDLDRLRLETTTAFDEKNADYTELLKRIMAFDAGATVWAQAADDLSALARAVRQAENSLASTGFEGGRPSLLLVADDVLTGRPLALADLGALRQQCTSTTDLLRRWTRVLASVAQLHRRVEALAERARTAGSTIPSSITSSLAQLRATAVSASTQAELDSPELPKSATALEVAIEEAEHQLNSVQPNIAAAQPMIKAQVSAAPLAPRGETTIPLPASLRTQRSPEAYVRQHDRAYYALALLVAVGTGLIKLYAGKPFGSGSDYLTAVLWGFGAKAGFDVLLSGIDRLVGRASGLST